MNVLEEVNGSPDPEFDNDEFSAIFADALGKREE